jgi:aquaporin TIP
MPTLVPRDLDARFANALQAEFLGTALLQFLSALSGTSWGYGFSYAALVYATQHLSGGHLNPVISIATATSGHMHWLKAVLYVVAQIVGGIAGALLEAALVPGLTWAWFGHHNKEHAPGCFYPGPINSWELFLWELVLTFVLVYVVYAVAVAEPGHGNVGPLVMGVTIFAAAEAGARFSGASMNPARLIGAATVFLCTPQRSFWLYLLGQVLGGLLAAGVSAGAYGVGRAYEGYHGTSSREDPLLGTTVETTVRDV